MMSKYTLFLWVPLLHGDWKGLIHFPSTNSKWGGSSHKLPFQNKRGCNPPPTPFIALLGWAIWSQICYLKRNFRSEGIFLGNLKRNPLSEAHVNCFCSWIIDITNDSVNNWQGKNDICFFNNNDEYHQWVVLPWISPGDWKRLIQFLHYQLKTWGGGSSHNTLLKIRQVATHQPVLSSLIERFEAKYVTWSLTLIWRKFLRKSKAFLYYFFNNKVMRKDTSFLSVK